MIFPKDVRNLFVGSNCLLVRFSGILTNIYLSLRKSDVCDLTGWGRKDVRTVFASGMVAGLSMTATVSPFDRIRTALMNQPTDKKIYNGFADAAMKIVQADGPFSLWRGFIPIWMRFAPTATIQLLTIEALYSHFGFANI